MRIKIASVGEAVLRNAARVLRPEEIDTDRIRELIKHMRETLDDAPGVGLAAALSRRAARNRATRPDAAAKGAF